MSVDLRDDDIQRDAEQSLVAALQESDTAVEALQDSAVEASDEARSRRWRVGAAGLVLALIGLLVARRRR